MTAEMGYTGENISTNPTGPLASQVRKLTRIRKRLEDPTVLLRQIGIVVAKNAQKSFDEQSFGSNSWSPRYKGTRAGAEPSINIAGALQDFTEGKRKPKNRRFQTTPALMDTGLLRRSLGVSNSVKRVSSHAVVVGVFGKAEFYAPYQQFGGTRKTPVTEGALDNYSYWMKGLKEKRRSIGTYDKSSKKWIENSAGRAKSGGTASDKSSSRKATPRKSTPRKSGSGKSESRKSPTAEKKTSSVFDSFLRMIKDAASKGKKSIVQGVMKQGVRFSMKKEDTSKPKRTKQDRLDNLSEMVKRAEKMGFLYKTKMLTTDIAARPFLGITARVSQEITRTIQDRFADRTKKS
tara:strand:+ start:16102 stop:17145 length:1044 start_codon:yes stop_codon:yes gene_type:complete